MKVKYVRGGSGSKPCGHSPTCPTLYVTDHRTYVVQGYIVPTGPEVPDGEAVVEVPLYMLPELAGADSRDGLVLTDRGTILVRGVQVTDSEALDMLMLPEGENAVEVPLLMLSEVEILNA